MRTPRSAAYLRDRARSGAAWARENGARAAMLVGLVMVVLGGAAFLAVVDSVREADDLAQLDEPVLHALASGRSDVLTSVLTAVTTVSGPVVLPIVALLGALAWATLGRQRWQAGLLAGAMIASTVASLAIKHVVARPRPPLDMMTVPGAATTYSFPSGHTIGAATLLLVVGYLAWVRRPTARALVLWLVVAGLGTGAVALSRLYLGYHFVTDVAASVALAVAVLGGVVTIDRRRAARAADRTADDGANPPAADGADPEGG